jgi:hypothetical protein
MARLVLLEKLYGPEEVKVTHLLQRSLSNATSDLDGAVELRGKTQRNWIQVDVYGSETTVLTNYLRQKYGIAAVSLDDVHEHDTRKGKIVDAGKVGYGVYVDIGVSTPESTDVLVPLYALRRQLADGVRLSTRQIIASLCLWANFPLDVRITKVDREKREVEAAISDRQVAVFRDWLRLGLDRIIAYGASIDTLHSAIRRSGLSRDVIEVGPIGLMEHSVLCKLGTTGSGVVKTLGRFLPGSPFCVFRPEAIRPSYPLRRDAQADQT